MKEITFKNEEIPIKTKELCLKRLVDELKKICQEIGCSGVDPDMCQNRPHHCSIIRDYCSPANKPIQPTSNTCG